MANQEMVDSAELESATPCVSSRYSNQLSYESILRQLCATILVNPLLYAGPAYRVKVQYTNNIEALCKKTKHLEKASLCQSCVTGLVWLHSVSIVSTRSGWGPALSDLITGEVNRLVRCAA